VVPFAPLVLPEPVVDPLAAEFSVVPFAPLVLPEPVVDPLAAEFVVPFAPLVLLGSGGVWGVF
jgi:hypothetical protein